MAPKRFRFSRLMRIVHEDPTATLELVVSFCYIIIPSVCLIIQRVYLPPITSDLFGAFGFSEQRMGFFALAFGILQIWGAGTHWYVVRAWIATILACSLSAVVLAYWFTGYMGRPTVPFMMGTVLSQMFISWRCWHERPNNHVRV